MAKHQHTIGSDHDLYPVRCQCLSLYYTVIIIELLVFYCRSVWLSKSLDMLLWKIPQFFGRCTNTVHPQLSESLWTTGKMFCSD